MSTHRYIDRLCAAAGALCLLFTLLFMNGEALGLRSEGRTVGYEDRLFDASRVHTLDIVMDGWEDFLDTCENEEYSACSIVLDGEAYQNVGLRAKGNTSLTSVSQMGSDRYSFKVEFDHYEAGKSYYGLDKLVLNNLIQDNTMMKDYLAYRLMGEFGVASPLCSFVYLTVNGEDWGLYLAVEGVEDAFLQRNYGGAGELYKPDSTGQDSGGAPRLLGGERQDPDGARQLPGEAGQGPNGEGPMFQGQEDGSPGREQRPGDGMGSDDVKLNYIDDDPDSYPNIFDNAKTDITQADESRLIASLKALSSGENLEQVLDVDQVLRYFVVHNFLVNGDSYTGNIIHNYYLYEQDGQLSMIPWDYNLAFGSFQGGSASAGVNDPIDEALSDRPMQAWIFSDENYTQRYHQLYAQFLEGAELESLIDETQALIAPYVERDPTKFCTYEQFQNGTEALKAFCALRLESVQGQLEGSIPSTSQGQREDAAALVDAGGLDLSDMGSMGAGGFGRGEQGGGARAQAAFAPADGQGFAGPGDFTLPGGQTQSGENAGAVLLGVSLLFLLGGLLFAFKFRR
ncbi:MAG: spore coat protein CotH [Lawsonibacter sp.]|nr:spore coat protein CotH [Lawsonibacter sp.]